jgi:hypothetical protein
MNEIHPSIQATVRHIYTYRKTDKDTELKTTTLFCVFRAPENM